MSKFFKSIHKKMAIMLIELNCPTNCFKGGMEIVARNTKKSITLFKISKIVFEFEISLFMSDAGDPF